MERIEVDAPWWALWAAAGVNVVVPWVLLPVAVRWGPAIVAAAGVVVVSLVVAAIARDREESDVAWSVVVGTVVGAALGWLVAWLQVLGGFA